MKTLLYTVIGFLLASPLLAQTPVGGKLNGQVNGAANKPLEFSTVMLLRATDSSLVKGAISDGNGLYAFEGIDGGTYLLAAQQLGYAKTISQPFTIDAAHATMTLPALVLTEESRKLSEVQVVAKKPFLEQQVDRVVMNVENSIVASGNTALDVLEKAPGVTIDRQNDQLKLKGKSGVIVYIDGKQTYLSQQEVSNLLKNTPSDNIEKIEIITNPGSKYDAAGNSGIINIKMKKNKNFGTNGTLTLGSGYGWANDLSGKNVNRPKYNGALNINHRAGKVNVFGNYSYGNRLSFNSNILNRVIPYNGTLTYFDQRSFRPSESSNHSFKGGLDYFLTKKTTIGVLVNGFVNDWSSPNGASNTLISDAGGQLTSKAITRTDADQYLKNLTTNLNVKHEFDDKGQELTADVDYVRYDGSGQNLLSTQYLDVLNRPIRANQDVRNTMPSTIDIIAFKSDYVKPIKNGKIEAGIKSSYVQADNNTVYDTLQQETRQWLFDASRSNRFKYDERINAGYLNYAGALGKLKIQAGLRAEHTRSTGNSITLNQRVDRNYLNLFPTLFLSRQLDSTNVLNLSYSRRIDRPSYQNLNPFVFYLDPYTYQQGNPFLRPQYTNALELTHVYKGSISTTLGFSRTTDFINSETPRQIAAQNITYITPENLGTQDNVNLNVSFPVAVAKWWTMQNNVTVYYQHYNTFYSGQPYSVKFVAYNLYASNNFTISKLWSAELSGWYNSPAQDGFYQARPMGAFSLGVQKKMLDNKGSLKLNVNDPFWLNHFNGIAKVQDINFRVQSRWESRRVSLTFTYRFGNQNVKSTRDRNSATSAEQGRVKGN